MATPTTEQLHAALRELVDALNADAMIRLEEAVGSHPDHNEKTAALVRLMKAKGDAQRVLGDL